MKRQKSKRFKKRKDLISAFIKGLYHRQGAVLNKQAEEKKLDEQFVEKNRLELEIYARNPV